MSERDELAKLIRNETGLSGTVWFEVSDVADEDSLAEALIAAGYRKVTVTPGQIEAAAKLLATPKGPLHNRPDWWSRIFEEDTREHYRDKVRVVLRSAGVSVAEDGGQ